ncbi:MAG: hypothetical protein JWQ38_1404 [Flavipsychrobacter sp.]|nr:hypothetical protein [Flavipsychrobacter sp.]
MSAIRNLINKFIDWAIKLRDADRRHSNNPNNQRSHFTPSPNELKKATKIVDETLFGIHKKED